MLRNRAALGEFQKRRKLNGKETPVGEPVPNYYPAVIDEDLFRAAQEARVEKLSGRLSPVLHPAMGKESRETELSTFGPLKTRVLRLQLAVKAQHGEQD